MQFRRHDQALAPVQVVASDLGRTRETARLIGYMDARLRELHMGICWRSCTAWLYVPPFRLTPISSDSAAILNFDEKTMRLRGYNIGALAPDIDVAN